MNHYDGPAFFRKYPIVKPNKPVSAASQSTSAASAATSQAQPVVSQAVRPVSSAAPVKPQTTPTSATSQAELFNSGTHGSFHPSQIPAQISPALATGGVIVDSDQTNYLEVEASLHKAPDSFFLMAKVTDDHLELVDLAHPELSQAATAAEPTVTFEPQATATTAAPTEVIAPQTTVQATVASTTAPTEVLQPQSAVASTTAPTEVIQPQSSAASTAAVTSTTAPTEVLQPQSAAVTTPASASASRARSIPTATETTQAVATEVFTPDSVGAKAAQQSMAALQHPTTVFEPDEAAVAALQTSLAAPSSMPAQVASLAAMAVADAEAESTAPSTAPTHGLGLSLGDIMTEEHNAQSDLALFKDAPKAEEGSVTTAATVENTTTPTTTTVSPTATTSAQAEEPYQPVGAQPRVQPTPAPRAITPARPVSPTTTAPMPVAATVAPTSAPVEAPHNPDSAAPVLDDKALAAYHLPPLDLLKAPVVPDESEMDDWIESKASALDESLDAFGVDANVVDWTIGPTVTQFQVKLARGVKVSKITNLNDDLKLALAAKDIRIEAPIPGRNTVGIEIPNKKSRPVMLSEVLNSEKFKTSKSPLTVALGVDLFGQPQVTDLRKMPHGLIAGATGSGKSVFINSILVSLLYKANPQEVKLLLIDPKAVEMAPYDKVPHLIAPVISEPKAASAALKWVVDEMDNRYDKLAAGGARNIEQFNQLAEDHHEPSLKMPYIVIVIDELADLMMVASSEVQDYIARITQKARAAGIHLLVATQRPSVDVVTGLIKNNIPTRVAFMVASQIDSRTILDASGAERLLGRGDMLYLGNGQSTPIRLQGTYVDSEIDDIAQYVRDQAAPHYEFQPDSLMKHEEAAKNQDELMPEVLAYLAEEDTVSTSKLQRKFSVGYNRAANIIDDLEGRGYVSPAKGSKPRDIYFSADDLTKLQANS
ncbi:DNA translocase FtsK [Lactiplantibacillus fabifermentans]|nr:DNA translocase FtsK [Lactiplantibacillus fabifermentans]ETY74448.1 cell division protein FtsK [Lactiplantibacillus fabifermentans T30PCM01]